VSPLASQKRKYLQKVKTSRANLQAEVSDMEMVALAMLCIGSALGLRFRVFVLFPVILLGLIASTAYGLAQGTTIWSITITNLVGATCLQFGYLGGALLKGLIFAGRFDGTKSSQSVQPLAH
jgi:hypothetical protein